MNMNTLTIRVRFVPQIVTFEGRVVQREVAAGGVLDEKAVTGVCSKNGSSSRMSTPDGAARRAKVVLSFMSACVSLPRQGGDMRILFVE
jgi:hypothetical protein